MGLAARHGLISLTWLNFTKQLADQVAKDNILINAVPPGTALTPRMASVMQGEADAFNITFEEARQRKLDEIPLGRF